MFKEFSVIAELHSWFFKMLSPLKKNTHTFNLLTIYLYDTSFVFFIVVPKNYTVFTLNAPFVDCLI